MISNPNLIFYACIAKGSTILTEFSPSEEPGIQTIAQRCIEKTPPHHSTFSHTILNKSYTFLIHDPFAYFVVSHENLDKSEVLRFLHRVKSVFQEFMLSRDNDKLASLCFQAQFYPLFREILALDVDSSLEESTGSRNRSVGARRIIAKPSVLKASKVVAMMKKKKGSFGEEDGDHHLVKNDGNVGENRSKELSVSMMQKGGSGAFFLGDGKQKAKQIWRKHVWVVLIMDVVICSVLFGVWLMVCRGFKCIGD